MKLPGIEYKGVAPLPTISPNTALRETQAINDAISAVGQAADTIYNSIQKERFMSAKSVTDRLLDEFQITMQNKPAMKPDEFEREWQDGISRIQEKARDTLDPNSAAARMWTIDFQKQERERWKKTKSVSTLQAVKLQREEAKIRLKKTARTNLDSAVDQLEASDMFTPEEKEIMMPDLIKQSEWGSVELAMESGTPLVIQSEIARLESGDTYLQDGDRKRAIGWLKESYKTAAAKGEEFIKARDAKYASNLELLINTGRGKPQDIEDAYDTGLITGKKRTELYKLWEKKNKEVEEKANLRSIVFNAINGDYPLDPGNTEHQKAIDQVYSDLGKEDLTWAASVAKASNILPSQVKANLRRFSMAGSPQQTSRYANLFVSLQGNAPQAINKLSDKDKVIYETVAALTRGGVPVDEAVKKAREVATVPPERLQQLRNSYPSEGAGERLQDMYDADDSFDLEIIGSPDITPSALATYRQLEKLYYSLTDGDIAIAETAAKREFKRIYGGTILAGDSVKVIPYAPEKWYGMSSEESAWNKGKLEEEYGEGVFVVPDSRTARDLTYGLYKKTNGLPEPVMRGDEPVRWQPDKNGYRAYLERSARAEQAALERERKKIGGRPQFRPTEKTPEEGQQAGQLTTDILP